MKKTVLLQILLSAALSFFYSEEVQVPDLETRIKNSGSTIPESALPVLKPPVPSSLPAPGTVIPPAEQEAVVPHVVPVETPPPPLIYGNDPILSGFVDFGAGSPGILYGEISLMRTAGDIPGFASNFRYDSSDRYGYEKTGTGYFNRKTVLGVRLFDDTNENPWFTSIRLSDRIDGKKGDLGDVSQTGRDVSWDSGIQQMLFNDSGFSLLANFGGMVFSSTASTTGAYNGFFLTPRAALSYAAGAFTAEFYGQYGYETVADFGELLNGSAGFKVHYSRWGVTVNAMTAAFVDSMDGFIVPFDLALSYDNLSSPLSRVWAEGGLSTDKSAPLMLAFNKPFAALERVSVYSSDWNVKGGINIAPDKMFSIHTEAEFRRTAFDRGIFVLTDAEDGITGLIPSVRVNRDSFVTRISAGWSLTGAEITAGYTGEWLDRLYQDSLHKAQAGIKLFERSVARIWEVSADSSFALDTLALPDIDLKGTVRPFHDLSLSLSLNDLCKAREFILSARLAL